MMNHTSSVLKPAANGTRHHAWMDRFDPRLRIVTATAVSVVVAVADRFEVLLAALGLAVLGSVVSALAPAAVIKRLLPLNLLMLVLVLLLPLTTEGATLWQIGPLEFSREGLLLARAIALKGNAIVLTLLVLLASMEAATLGHALGHLRVPDKLTHLLLFTVRYLDVLHREYLRLRAAMKVRAFRPRMDRHTYRSYGYLVGMLLVRSFDRAERIAAAMKCRGFRGRFYLLDHFAFSRRDLAFAAASLAILLTMVWMEWS